MAITLLQEARDLYAELVAIRRDLHAHPEMGFGEVRTASVVVDHLTALGYEVVTGVGRTGVVGLLPGGQPGDRTVLLRFDMDALPIHEENDVAYRSQTPGVMHACGHDAHVAVGLGVARLLAQHRAEFGGVVKLMFQPAEEGMGGAMAMIQDAVLTNPNVDVAFGLHVSPDHATGTAVVRSGALLAAVDRFEIIVQGQGGHAARPDQAIDPVLVAAHIVVALQTIVARNINPLETGVITVGSMHAGETHNVIPANARLLGTIRSFSPDVREILHARVQAIAQGVAAALGATADVQIVPGVDPTVNAPGPTTLVQQIASELLGKEQVDTEWRTTGGEDFSAVLARVPGTFFFLGAHDPARGSSFPLHHPRFDIDENCLPLGVAILCEAALRFFATFDH